MPGDRSHDAQLPQRSGREPQSVQAGRVDAVVVGEQEGHCNLSRLGQNPGKRKLYP
jgi:hypothetical protein